MSKDNVKYYVVSTAVTEDNLKDIIIDGIENGTPHWALIWNDLPIFDQYRNNTELPLSEQIADIILKQHSEVKITDVSEDEPAKYALTLERLIKGIQLNAEQRPWDADLENYDADTTDCIFQYAIFDDVIYS